MDRELKRGTLEMVILRLLADHSMYGFELISTMHTRSNGTFEMKEGTIYPVLYRMEEAGLIEPRWQADGRAAPRKYYEITVAGRAELERQAEEWTNFRNAIDQLLGQSGTGTRRRK